MKNPSPSGKPEKAVDSHQVCGDRSTQAGDTDEGHDPRHCFASIPIREPLRDEEQHAGRKAGFGNTQQESCCHQSAGTLNERGSDGDHAPRDHDSCDPAPRTDLCEDVVARGFADRVTPEIDSGRKPEHRGRYSEFFVHRQCCNADVQSVEIQDDVCQSDDRHEAEHDLPDGPGRKGKLLGDCSFVTHDSPRTHSNTSL